MHCMYVIVIIVWVTYNALYLETSFLSTRTLLERITKLQCAWMISVFIMFHITLTSQVMN